MPSKQKINAYFEDLISLFKKHDIQVLDGIYQFEILDSPIERISLRSESNHIEIFQEFLVPSQGHLSTKSEILLEVFNGNVDPMAQINVHDFCYVRNDGKVSKQYDPDEVRLLTLLYQCFNSHHLSLRFQDHLLGSYYRTGKFINPEGKAVLPGAWPVTAAIGEILFDIVSKQEINRTLEIGFAYGVSAMFICEAHRYKGNGMHTAIDPWQENYFQNIGLHNIKSSDLLDYFDFKSKPDWLVLPELIQQEEKFDLVFIDGLHLFDVVMLDFFYTDLLLRPGGYLLFDDISFPGVAPAVYYVLKHRAYQEIEQKFDRLLVLQKIQNDDRTKAMTDRSV